MMLVRFWETDELVVDLLLLDDKENQFVLHNPYDEDEYIMVGKKELVAFTKALQESEDKNDN